MAETPYTETIFLDADMVAAADISSWFEALGTDDFTFWNERRTIENTPDDMKLNFMNPHVFCPAYGVEEALVNFGGGHYFMRLGNRAQAVLQRMAEVMQEAAEDPDCRYWQLAGRGNFISDEAAVSMAAVEFSLELPPPSPAAAPPIGQLLPPYQQWLEADFSANQLRLYDAGNRQEMVPQVVHFANCGKNDPAYQRWIEQVVTRQPFSDTGGEKCCYRNQQ